MKRYISLLLFTLLIMVSACRGKCGICTKTDASGIHYQQDICRKDFGNRIAWKAEIKSLESEGYVCAIRL